MWFCALGVLLISLDIVEGLEKVDVYGGLSTHAYYFMDVLIGTPFPQVQSAIVDTGSPTLSLPCKETCSSQNSTQSSCVISPLDAYFDVSKSLTAKWEKCNNNCTCDSDTCSYSMAYGEGSSISGHWISDFISLAGRDGEGTVPSRITFGCHTEVTSLFLTQKANGIIGLCYWNSALYTSFLNQVFSAPAIESSDSQMVNTNYNHNTRPSIFSSCFSHKGGLMYIHGWPMPSRKAIFPSSSTEKDHYMVWTPFVDPNMYIIVLTGVRSSDNSTNIQLSPEWGGLTTLVDSGATASALPKDAYDLLLSLLDVGCSSLPNGCDKSKLKNASGRPCFRVPNGEVDVLAHFQPIVFTLLGGGEVFWNSNQYLYPANQQGTVWCLAAKQQISWSTFGAGFFVNSLLVFDRENERFGIRTGVKCPSRDLAHDRDWQEINLSGFQNLTTSDSRNGRIPLHRPPPAVYSAPVVHLPNSHAGRVQRMQFPNLRNYGAPASTTRDVAESSDSDTMSALHVKSFSPQQVVRGFDGNTKKLNRKSGKLWSHIDTKKSDRIPQMKTVNDYSPSELAKELSFAKPLFDEEELDEIGPEIIRSLEPFEFEFKVDNSGSLSATDSFSPNDVIEILADIEQGSLGSNVAIINESLQMLVEETRQAAEALIESRGVGGREDEEDRLELLATLAMFKD